MIKDEYRERYRMGVPLAVYGLDCDEGHYTDTSGFYSDEAETVLSRRKNLASPHNHAEFEIILIERGTADFRVGQELFTLGAGDVLLVNQYEVHSADQSGYNGAYAHKCVDFDLSFLPDIPGDELFLGLAGMTRRTVNHVRTGTFAAKTIAREIPEIFHEYQTAEPGWQTSIRGRLYLIFSALTRDGLVTSEIPKVRRRDGLFAKEVIDYVGEHISSEMTTGGIAGSLSYSEAYFCRLFRRVFGRSFRDYVTDRRITAAMSMFDQGEKSVTLVANSVGMPNLSYFAKRFREHTGVSPSEYAGKKTET